MHYGISAVHWVHSALEDIMICVGDIISGLKENHLINKFSSNHASLT